MRYLLIAISVLFLSSCTKDVGVSSSLAWKQNKAQVSEITSPNAIEYNTLLHHGPAIENQFYALRLYFNNSGAIDVYNKSQQRLELLETAWYPDSLKQLSGYGADQYKVGATLGLGGIALWADGQIIKLEATRGRSAKVYQENGAAIMEMIAHGVEYRNEKIDVTIKVELQAQNRWAKVYATTSCTHLVQFVTGVNYHKDAHLMNKDGAVVAWGIHPEDVAFKPGNIGAAIVYDTDDIENIIDDGAQIILISTPRTHLETHITTVSENESEINTFSKLCDYTSHH